MNRKAFTMIELLTVIAIIAILAAIIFPVGARVKAAAFRSSDMANLNEVRTAIQLYKADQEVYPPQLLGYASLYSPVTGDGQVVPANLARSYVSPRPMALGELNSNQNKVSPTDITTAVWPNQDSCAPQLDLNGDGTIDTNPGACQKYGPSQLVRRNGPGASGADPAQLPLLSKDDYLRDTTTYGRTEVIDTPKYPGHATMDSNQNWMFDAYFYKISGFDVGTVKGAGASRTELRYTLFWSAFGLTTGDKTDDPRQLGYAEPPDNTVVTWNSYWREYDETGDPTSNKNDMVLFLGGGAKAWPSDNVSQHSWRLVP